MLDENTQYALSQYLDGTLHQTERDALEELLRTHAEARETLGQYRRLNTLLAAGAGPLPSVDWDAFSQGISKAVDEQGALPLAAVAAEAEARQHAWLGAPRTWLMAASLLLACGVTWLITQRSIPLPVTGASPTAADVRVLQPQESPSGIAIAEITIGPAPAAQTTAIWELHPDMVEDRPASVSIAAGPQIATRDELFQIYQ